MISRRPVHMSRIMTVFANGLNPSKEPIGPAKPNPGPTFPSVVAAAPIASIGPQAGVRHGGVDHEHERADEEQHEVEHPEREDRAERPLLDGPPVEADRHDRLAVQRLVELACDELADQKPAHDLDGAGRRAGGAADQHQAA